MTFKIGLVDTLHHYGIEPDGIIGHSLGELACFYADGCLTAKQTFLVAYARGKCINKAKLRPGAMAAVSKS